MARKVVKKGARVGAPTAKGRDAGKPKGPKVPSELPILPLRNTLLFPGSIIPLSVGRESSVQLVRDALLGDKVVGVVAQKEPETDDVRPDDIYRIGTVTQILKLLKMPDGNQHIVVQGLSRFRIAKIVSKKPYLRARIEVLEDAEEESDEIAAMVMRLKGLALRAIELAPHIPSEVSTVIENTDSPAGLVAFVAANLSVAVAEKQEILETDTLPDRLKKIIGLLSRELEVMELGSKIQSKVRGAMEKSQKEYYLREQMKAIQSELGEEDDRSREVEELRAKIRKAKMPAHARKEADGELDRLLRIPPAAPEYSVIRTYLDWLIQLPWAKSTKDRLDTKAAHKVLEEDHYGLDKVKKRIVEYLAVRKLKPDSKGPILCFVGPPGVGKTSLGKSIARSLGREFVRMSLGGVRDEAEIRGHRRTYVGALPGRIIQGIKRAGSNNPVFMLDEVDKLGVDFRGDPSSALLEVLDPEQNNSFSDHYLDVAFDLSRVMFITTANVLTTVPAPLLDRMEVLELPGYTEEEKLEIAKRYLVPRQLGEHGLGPKLLAFRDEALLRIIRAYTREAGVRNLEREIASVCRAVARTVAEGRKRKTTVDAGDLDAYLGQKKFYREVAERTAAPGVATGLAWTPAGGDILFVEVARMPGKGQLVLTGQLGEVMQESARAALSCVRSRAKALRIAAPVFRKNDIHIHVPAGAIAKDGPSAGVAIYTALVSLLKGKPIRSTVAMTGEITLRGLVLPVGGIKEKILAARSAGIKTVVLPEKNRKDLDDVPERARSQLTFRFVSVLDELLPIAFGRPKKSASKRRRTKRA